MNRIVPDNPIYRACREVARKSPCQKKKVGAVLVFNGKLITAACNGPIDDLKLLCDPECIRLTIPNCDRTLGACSHAEERLLWHVVGNTTRLHMASSHLYVVSLATDDRRERLVRQGFSCLQCARAIHFAGIASVSTAWLGEWWVHQTPHEALVTASDYVLKQFLNARR